MVYTMLWRNMLPIRPGIPGQVSWCTGFFYVRYITRPIFTSHLKDAAKMVNCLALGIEYHYRDSNPHSADQNPRAWVQCSNPLDHDTPVKHLPSSWRKHLLTWEVSPPRRRDLDSSPVNKCCQSNWVISLWHTGCCVPYHCRGGKSWKSE